METEAPKYDLTNRRIQGYKAISRTTTTAIRNTIPMTIFADFRLGRSSDFIAHRADIVRLFYTLAAKALADNRRRSNN